jgi:lysophospholipid acyltransferase (LPLAT)-like uncharacterized protein
MTLRVRFEGKDQIVFALQNASVGSIFIMWHDSLLVSPLLAWVTRLQPVHVLISNSRDGDIPSAVLAHYRSLYPLRVKHLAKAQAIRSACTILEKRCSIFITPDGPRGPRRQIKSGALFACEETGALVIPVSVGMSRCIQLSSWDRFRIPLPFSKVVISLGTPQSFHDTPEEKRLLEEMMITQEIALQSFL